jgi:hypothetical protein
LYLLKMRELIKDILKKELLFSENRLMWTDDKIRDEAKKYNKVSEFIKNSKSAYSAAKRKGDEYFKDITSHMDVSNYRFWSDDELRDEALKYNSKNEFAKGSPSASGRALSRGKEFYDSITSHMEKLKRDKWTDDELRQEALKYNTKAEFAKNSPSASQIANRRGKEFWDEVTSHMTPIIHMWTDDELRQEALKYNTKSEFRDKSPNAHQVAMNRGKEFWDDVTSHMEILNRKWTDDDLRKEASKYETLADFWRFSSSAARTAMDRGREFYDDITSGLKKITQWTDEMLKDEALKYKTMPEFRKQSPNAYQAADSRKILKDITTHMELTGSKYKRLIYAYEFPDNNVYVGLTYNLNRRDKGHMKRGTSAVYLHMEKTGLAPIRKSKTVYINREEAKDMEGKILQDYKDKGWNILNRAKTGGLGGGTKKWTKENIQKESLKYDNLSDFYKFAPSAINAAKSFGQDFYNQVTSHMNKKITYWSDEMLKDEALKYQTKQDFRDNNERAYNTAKRRGEDFYNQITSHMKPQRTYWSDEMLRDESSKYETRTKFARNNPSAYATARRRGLLDSLFPIK